ncbi:hypothetical protein RRG08_007236 [Elysia crispata]|uniref:Uncharacterized protein n=1 Tax=Elysia crispata TaxID=231223 RepID=A0AAE0ZT29_9GAST|nr:hypothetical protein RRG08_007236 [Elysia crispata]
MTWREAKNFTGDVQNWNDMEGSKEFHRRRSELESQGGKQGLFWILENLRSVMTERKDETTLDTVTLERASQ